MEFMKLTRQECAEILAKAGITDITYSTGRGANNTYIRKGFYGHSKKRGQIIYLSPDLDRLRLRAKHVYEHIESKS